MFSCGVFSIPSFHQGKAALGFIGAVFLLSGCATENGPPSTMTPSAVPSSAKAPPSSDVSRLEAWKDAQLIASMGEGRLEVVGSGESMQPVYGENTILVINRIAFGELKPAMSVAYTNERGHRVVHQLVSKGSDGWRVQGLNNDVEDAERVTPDNLIGVVYASFAYNPEL